MEKDVKEILMQLVEGQKQMAADISNLKEGQKQTNERLDRMEKDISDIKSDIAVIKYDTNVTRVAVNVSGNELEQLVDFVNQYAPTKFKYDPNK